jgi:hypothetical protein
MNLVGKLNEAKNVPWPLIPGWDLARPRGQKSAGQPPLQPTLLMASLLSVGV